MGTRHFVLKSFVILTCMESSWRGAVRIYARGSKDKRTDENISRVDTWPYSSYDAVTGARDTLIRIAHVFRFVRNWVPYTLRELADESTTVVSCRTRRQPRFRISSARRTLDLDRNWLSPTRSYGPASASSLVHVFVRRRTRVTGGMNVTEWT